jgi:hypothetical protein
MPDPRRIAAHDTIAGSCPGNRSGPVKIKTLECFLADRRIGIHTNAVERAIPDSALQAEAARLSLDRSRTNVLVLMCQT